MPPVGNALTISEGWLDFEPDATPYTVYVTRDTESVVLTPTTLHPEATVTVNGGAPASAVALNKGGNITPIVVTAADGVTTQTYSVTVFRGATHDYSAFVAQMYEWRNRPRWASYKEHTDRWDRALLAFGETVADTTLTPMTAAEAQSIADRGSEWHRWVSVADALRDIEESRMQRQRQDQQRQRQEQPQSTDDTVPQDSDPPNLAPMVASAIADIAGLETGATLDVLLSGVFSDADSDSLTITAESSDDNKATVTVAGDQSKLTVSGVSAGTATITVTAEDSDGNSVSDTFDVSVAKSQSESQSVTDVPGAVTDLNASISDTADSITVSWRAPESGGAVKRYIAHAQLVKGGTGSGKTRYSEAGELSVTFPNVEAGMTYKIWVRGENQVGKGERVHTTVELPTAPTDVPGPVVNLHLSATADSVTAAWDAPENGDTPTRYIVHIRPEDGDTGSGKTKYLKMKKSETTFSGLEAGRTYKVWVRGENDVGKGERMHATITLAE